MKEYDHRFLIPSEGEERNKTAYKSRLKSILPQYPDEVINQWFIDNVDTAREFYWLDLLNLTFVKETWPKDSIPRSDFGNVECVTAYREHLDAGDWLNRERGRRLMQSFEEKGTWPVGPIFLHNPNRDLWIKPDYPAGAPFHLLEGHNRMACFLSFRDRGSIADQHSVWVTHLGGQ